MPEWKNVESPMNPTTGRSETMANPLPADTEDPMQNRKSAARKGGTMPSV